MSLSEDADDGSLRRQIGRQNTHKQQTQYGNLHRRNYYKFNIQNKPYFCERKVNKNNSKFIYISIHSILSQYFSINILKNCLIYFKQWLVSCACSHQIRLLQPSGYIILTKKYYRLGWQVLQVSNVELYSKFCIFLSQYTKSILTPVLQLYHIALIINRIIQHLLQTIYMIPQDQQRVILSLVLSIPLSYALRLIPHRSVKQIYSFIAGTALQLYVYQTGLPYAFVLHMLVYAITVVEPKKCGPIVTVLTLLLLSIYHIYRLITDYGSWSLDISTVLMTMVCKYSLYAYSVQDAHTKPQKLTKQQIFHQIQHTPSIFQYLSYCQFLPTAVIGTAIDYKIYNHYMSQKQDFKHIPAPWKNISYDIAYSALLGTIYLLGEIYFPLLQIQTEQFPQQSLLYIIFYCFISVTFVRFKYYFAWKFSMGAVHASGVSYQVHADGKSDFKRIQTCNPHIVQTTMHIRQKIANWNMSAQQWLRRCIYERSPLRSKPINQLITFLVSSFWHGFYGGYYITFFCWFAQTHLQQMIFNETKRQKSFYVKYYKMTGLIGKFLLWFAANLLFSFIGTFFLILSLQQGLKILKATYFISFIVLFGLIALFTFIPGGKPVRKRAQADPQKTKLVKKLSDLEEAKKLLQDQKQKIENQIQNIQQIKDNIELQEQKKIR